MKVACTCGFGLRHCYRCGGSGLMDIEPELLVSQADFEAYEAVRESGLTNMFDTRKVIEYSGLTADKIKAIRQNYDLFAGKYKQEVKQ